jgi:hypothetical protein
MQATGRRVIARSRGPIMLRRYAFGNSNAISRKALVASGMVLIACGLMWPQATSLHGSMSSGSVDFIQGFLVGIGIACEIMGIVSMAARGKGMDSSSPPSRD